MESALLALFDEYGDKTYLPKKASKKLTADGEAYALSQQEYEQYTKRRGELAHGLFETELNAESFKNASGECQLSAINSVWSYANQTAGYEINDGVKRDAWVRNAGDDPAGKVLEKLDETIVSYRKEQYKDGFYTALEDGDIESMRMCFAGLKEMGGSTASSFRKAVTENCKEEYLKLYEEGDTQGMADMKEALLAAGMGYREGDFMKWMGGTGK